MGFYALKCACREWFECISHTRAHTAHHTQTHIHTHTYRSSIYALPVCHLHFHPTFDTNSINRNHQTVSEWVSVCVCGSGCSSCGKYAEKCQDTTKCWNINVHRTSNCMSLSTNIRLYGMYTIHVRRTACIYLPTSTILHIARTHINFICMNMMYLLQLYGDEMWFFVCIYAERIPFEGYFYFVSHRITHIWVRELQFSQTKRNTEDGWLSVHSHGVASNLFSRVFNLMQFEYSCIWCKWRRWQSENDAWV